MTIERILPGTEMSETEWFNARRVETGRKPIQSRITKIRPGLRLACGPDCRIEEWVPGWGFTEFHGPNCRNKVEFQVLTVSVTANGQACAALADDNGEPITGVMILNGLFPHEV